MLDVAGVEEVLTEERKAGDGVGVEAEMGGEGEDEAQIWLGTSLRE